MTHTLIKTVNKEGAIFKILGVAHEKGRYVIVIDFKIDGLSVHGPFDWDEAMIHFKKMKRSRKMFGAGDIISLTYISSTPVL